jgi:hypothetical protein
LTALIANAATGVRIAAVVFSPPGHWASLLIDTHAGTISWGDSIISKIQIDLDALRALVQDKIRE